MSTWGFLLHCVRDSSHTQKHLCCFQFCFIKKTKQGFPGGAVVKNLPANTGDTGSSPGPGRSHMPRSS